MARSVKQGVTVTRRQLLIGGGIGAGLVIGWSLWPRAYQTNLIANPGETILGAFLKIAESGQITVVVPQSEMGQGVYTALPQVLADELGADWRTIAVEPAPISPIYANQLLAGQMAEGGRPGFLRNIARWSAQEIAKRDSLMITGFSSSIRAFEQTFREAGAAARVLLCKAAARRWESDWLACDTQEGFVVRGEEKLRFGPLAAEALDFKVPDPLPLREGKENRLTGQSLPRLDTPAKIDGSANFASDVRLPDMVYASIRQGPVGDARLVGFDRAAADAIPGVMALVDTPRWLATVANNWWAANRALDAARPKFAMTGTLVEQPAIVEALRKGVEGDGVRIVAQGDLASVYRGKTIRTADYSVGFAVHAPMETVSATARIQRGKLELWMATDAPSLAREAAARALHLALDDVTIHPMMGGGSFGRRLENEVAAQAAIIAMKVNRPVQLIWSRAEDIIHDRFRPPAFARMSAYTGVTGRIDGWLAKIAAPSTGMEQAQRILAGHAAAGLYIPDGEDGDYSAVAGAVPPYAISAYAVDHHPVSIPVPTGHWRSGAHASSAFFTESFVDELAHAVGIEPLSFRMQLLGNRPRLARCLAAVTAKGGWQGGIAGSGQGIACHSMAGSYVAILAEAHIDAAQKIIVDRVFAVVDCGRVINPDLVRQQIEGGIMFGIAAATGGAIEFERGMPRARNFTQLDFPRLGSAPEITVDIVRSDAAPGGVSEIAVPPIAPAIANAIYAASGQRMRSLPLRTGGAS